MELKHCLVLVVMLMIPAVSAETYIVVNESGYVQWKGDTYTRPNIPEGYKIIPHQDINSVLKDAKYDGVSFVNPEAPAFVRYEEKLVAVSATGLDPVTQAAINFAAGGAGAYLVVRRRKTT